MPGIAGIVGLRDEERARREVAAMISSMRHDPTYLHGFISDRDQAVYAGWVAHPDTFAASRSGKRAGSPTAVAFCGELFGSRSSDSTTETIVDLTPGDGERFGAKHVRRLNGLFSGLVVDSPSGDAYLFCDRYPMERLYVHESDGIVYFASEIKALLFILPNLRELDPKGVAQFLAYGCTFETQTLFRGVTRLSGASLWHFRNGESVSRGVYFTPKEWAEQSEMSESRFEDQFVSTFRAVLPRYFGQTNELGISITGGLDTRMIMACIPGTEYSPVCYTYAGLSGETLDVRVGRQIAEACGLSHVALRLGPDFLSDFQQYLDDTVFITDGSAGPMGAHEIYFSELARQQSLFRLTGNYGSEVLRGVSTLKPTWHPAGLLSVSHEELLHAADIPVAGDGAVSQSAFREIPWHLFGTLAACRSLQVFRTPYLDNDLVQLAYRAPEASRTSSRSALALIQACNTRMGAIPTDRGVRAGDGRLTAAVKRVGTGLSFKLDYLDKEGLPGKLRGFDPLLGALSRAGLLGRHKYLPYRRWFRSELRPVLKDALRRAKTDGFPWIDGQGLGDIDSGHSTGRINGLVQINAILTLEAVNRLLVRGEGFGRIEMLDFRD